MFTGKAYDLFSSYTQIISQFYCVPLVKNTSTKELEAASTQKILIYIVLNTFSPIHCLYDGFHLWRELSKAKINTRDLFLLLMLFFSTLVDSAFYLTVVNRKSRIVRNMRRLTKKFESGIVFEFQN